MTKNTDQFELKNLKMNLIPCDKETDLVFSLY